MRKNSWICRILIVLLCIFGVGYAIPCIIDGDLYEVLIRLSIILTAFIPMILRKLFHMHITPLVEIFYLLFIFLGHFLGSIVGLYNTVNNFDKIVHTISGVLTGLVALLLLRNMNKYQSSAILFNIIFILSLTLAVAGVWEIFEYVNDIIFKANAQHVLETGINDTMLDIIVAGIGGIIVSIIYIYETLKNKKGFIYHAVEE